MVLCTLKLLQHSFHLTLICSQVQLHDALASLLAVCCAEMVVLLEGGSSGLFGCQQDLPSSPFGEEHTQAWYTQFDRNLHPRSREK